MTSPFDEFEVEKELRPQARGLAFDLDEALASLVVLQARIPADAFTAKTLGSERWGNGIVIGAKGLVLTIGYLITEADDVTLIANDGRQVSAHVLGYDPVSGFGLVHALEPLELPACRVKRSLLVLIAVIEEWASELDPFRQDPIYRLLSQSGVVVEIADVLAAEDPHIINVFLNGLRRQIRLRQILEEGPEAGYQLFTRRHIFLQPHPRTRPTVQIPAVVFKERGRHRGRAVYFGSSRRHYLPHHAATHHDFKPLPSFPGFRLSAGPLQFRPQEHRDHSASAQRFDGGLFALPPASARL